MRFTNVVLILALVSPGQAMAQACALQPVAEADLAPLFRGHGVMVDAARTALAFRSPLERDEDGMPTAYHRGRPGIGDVGSDPGADHICAGADVLEMVSKTVNGRVTQALVSKYGKHGSVGDLRRDGGHALQCKADYIKLRDAGFPSCGPQQALCMRWYGVKAKYRSCGYDRPKQNCGVPIRQRDVRGDETDYYVTTNILRRPGSDRDSDVQADYADASTIPFIVLPDGVALPAAMRSGAGDYAAVVVDGRVAFALVGDSGPSYGLGEASRALLGKFGVSSVGVSPGAFTVLFPGSSNYADRAWPIDPASIESEGITRLQALFGGSPAQALAKLKQCAAS